MSTVIENPSSATAQDLIGRDYLSYSAISSFQRCPLRFYFRYVEGLPEENVSASLVFGGAIHRAAELHFRHVLEGEPAPDLAALLREYELAWQERDTGQVQFGKKEDIDSLRLLAERMLRAFQESEFAKPRGAIVGIEEELRGELIEGVPDLLARIDLIVDDEGSLVVTDLKTSRSRWSQSHVYEAAEQLLLYSELTRRLSPTSKVKLQFAVITKAKTPAVDVHVVDLNPQRMDRTKRVVDKVWKAIQAGHFYPSPSPMSCPSCPFRRPCGEWAG